jgi:hypothetical protein
MSRLYPCEGGGPFPCSREGGGRPVAPLGGIPSHAPVGGGVGPILPCEGVPTHVLVEGRSTPRFEWALRARTRVLCYALTRQSDFYASPEYRLSLQDCARVLQRMRRRRRDGRGRRP